MAGDTSKKNGKKGGRPKGAKSAATLEREAVFKAYRERVMGVTNLLFDAQLTLARGQTFLYKIEKELQIGPKGGKKYVSSKPKLVTDQREIEMYLEGLVDQGDMDDPKDPNATYYYLTTKEPNSMTIDSMMDRTYDKPSQGVKLTGADGGPVQHVVDITSSLSKVYGGAGAMSPNSKAGGKS